MIIEARMKITTLTLAEGLLRKSVLITNSPAYAFLFDG